jgi:hypothetical protein
MLPSDDLLQALTAPTNAVTIMEVPISTLYTDDMGRFPIRAQSGNQYIMVAFHDATSVILVEPFKSKADHCIRYPHEPSQKAGTYSGHAIHGQ